MIEEIIMKPAIIIIGESGSGKSTVANHITSIDKEYSNAIPYTTRPMRDGEKNGIDYIFISEEEFKDLSDDYFFITQSTYNGWKYGIAKDDCTDGKVIVTTPHGFRIIKQFINNISFYINVDRRSRLMKLLRRGDDIEEVYRRNLSDVGMFDGVNEEVDVVINNDEYHFDYKKIAKIILDIVNVGRILV